MPAIKKCPKCNRSMVALTLTIDDADRVLRSCSYCDVRMWEDHDGERTSLAGVLEELTVTKD